ncbi:MAG: outer membrane protein assembly factor BamD [Candidatus Aminicenantia bacterium]
MKRLSLLILLVLFLFSWCSKKSPENVPASGSSSDETLFNLGERWLKKDPEKARLYFRQVIDSFPQSILAQRAKLKIADTYFQQKDEGSLLIAEAEYREFISMYPFSPMASYARYQIAMTYYNKMYKPGRDQTNTLKAIEEFQRLIQDYPYAKEIEDAKAKLKKCKDNYIEHIYLIGLHYYKFKAHKAAINRFKEALEYNHEFSKIDRLFYYLGDALVITGNLDEGKAYFQKLISSFPNSKYTRKAQKRLKKIESLKK